MHAGDRRPRADSPRAVAGPPPIDALVFDLDGTLVQTETLKAESYYRVLRRLGGVPVEQADAYRAYASVVGRSSEEVVQAFLRLFQLGEGYEAVLGPAPGEAPWETLYRVRKEEYDRILREEPDALRRAQCPYATSVLTWARGRGMKTALATMSRKPQVDHVLGVLGLTDAFDAVVPRDQVATGKPDPEIYARTFAVLSLADPRAALVLEDSPAGAQAGLAAGARVLVVVNDLTRRHVHEAELDGQVAGVVEADPELLVTVEALVGGSRAPGR